MQFVVTSTGKPDYVEDRVSVGDVVNYDLDFSPWLEGKGTIASTVWTVEAGSVSSNDTDQAALLTFTGAGKSVVSCLVTTSTGEAKKVWLIIRAVDRVQNVNDYGMLL